MRKTHLSISVLTILGGFTCGHAEAAAGPARLLRDINQSPSYEMGSHPAEFHTNGGLSFFRADTPDTGAELCRTDGTEAGTFMVKDIWPGRNSGVRFFSFSSGTPPFAPADLGNTILFIANDGVHGWELWRSDGTEAGTVMVKDIRPGPSGPFDSNVQGLFWQHFDGGSLVYFIADDGVSGFELWRTDGTEAGTFMLRDIYAGTTGSMSSQLLAAEAGGVLYFAADDFVHGYELWRTDGTSGNTWMVKDIVPAHPSSAPGNFVVLNSTFMFWARTSTGFTGPWKSDGTEAGTVPVFEDFFPSLGVRPSSLVVKDDFIVYCGNQSLYQVDVTGEYAGTLHTFVGGDCRILGLFGGRVYLSVYEPARGTELWQSDGTQSGTSLVKDIYPGNYGSYPGELTSVGGNVLFLAEDGVHGRALWASDGTEAGTSMVLETTLGPNENILRLFGGGGLCYFTAYESGMGYRLWFTDGTAAGSGRIEKALLGGWEAVFLPDGSLLVSGDDGIHGAELWKSDGTENGTILVKDINPLYRNDDSSYGFLATVATPGIGQRIFFLADDHVHGYELWVSDGTPQGTHMVKELQPGPEDAYIGSAVAHAGALYFIAYDQAHGQELWRSDGTEAGTHMVLDIVPGPGGSIIPYLLVEFQGSVYFVADDGTRGYELWKSDGTAAGTVLAVETAPDSQSFIPEGLFASGDFLFFSAAASNYDYTLWRTDGTQAGTFLLRDPVSSGGPYSPYEFTKFAGGVFFKAFDLDHGYEPWVSDGTEAGTQLLRDIRPGPGSSLDYTLAQEMGGSMFFKADDGIHGAELWRTDGTEAGTELVKDLWPGVRTSGFTGLAPLNGFLYLDAATSFPISNEIWRTDGTEQGTVQIANNLGPNLYPMKGVTGGIVFTNQDATLGKELWTSDGTGKGTRLVQDIAPGPRDSLPQEYTEVGTRIFFLADDGVTGYEPWVVHAAILFRQPARAIEDMKADVKVLQLSAGHESSLMLKLDAAAQALASGKLPQTLDALTRFSIAVREKTPRFISDAAGADLLQFAADAMEILKHPDVDARGVPPQGVPPRFYATQ